jgi:uncharacterized protein
MKIERDVPDGRNTFTGYGEGYVEVNKVRHTTSVVVSEGGVVAWAATSVEGLSPALMASAAEGSPEIVILGTGPTFVFPDPAVLSPLRDARIGVEVMDTRAACRTYNILLGEGRRVTAALIVS